MGDQLGFNSWCIVISTCGNRRRTISGIRVLEVSRTHVEAQFRAAQRKENLYQYCSFNVSTKTKSDKFTVNNKVVVLFEDALRRVSGTPVKSTVADSHVGQFQNVPILSSIFR